MENPNNFISYIRVSTGRQGESGLGLSAQRESVERFLSSTGGVLVSQYIEIESGKKNDRQQLQAAISACREQKATLIIAKLDRLARNVHFISGLIESGIKFCAADMPSADRFMLHVYAAVAEEEARRISQRTKDALAAAKRRGVQLGKTGKLLAEQKKKDADSFAHVTGPTIKRLKDAGLSIRKISDRLNSHEIPSPSGGKWHPITVQRTWSRYLRLGG